MKKIKEVDKGIFDWLVNKNIYTDRGEPFEFRDHRFLKELFQDFHKRIVVKKCSQIGVSLALLSKILYLSDISEKGISTLYTLPTVDDVKDFVRTKFDTIILNSYLKEKAEGVRKEEKVYSIQLKKIDNAFFYFRGSKSKSKALSVSVDIWVGDEWDYQDQEVKEMYGERLKGSQSLDINWKVGNPTLVNYGISKEFENSTQKYWYIKCPICSHVQRLVWPDSIDKKSEEFICRKCKRPISDSVRRNGFWKATYPERKTQGYSFNRLMAPWFSAHDILEDYYNIKKKQNFYRFVLGEPYEGKGLNIKSKFPTFLTDSKLKVGYRIIGIDQGDKFYITSGMAGKDFRIIDFTAIADIPADINEIITTLKPDLVVMDSLPNKHLARMFQKQYGKTKFLLANERNLNNKTGNTFNVDYRDGVISADRTMVLDDMFESLEGKRLKINKDTANLDLFKKHLGSIIPDEKEVSGNLKRVYKKIGEDHFAFALSFFQLGASLLAPFEIEKKEMNKREEEEHIIKTIKDPDFEAALRRSRGDENWDVIKTI